LICSANKPFEALESRAKSLPLQWNTERFLREGVTLRVAERTFSIIKPDAVADGHASAILTEIDKAGFRIVAIRKESITKREAEGFYAVHSSKPFFADLTDFMASGPLFLMVLEKENAIADLRKLMGATNPANAEEGTIRKKFARSLGENAIHGSDAPDTAAFEIAYWFAGYELI
jgi:nucleoside-diphosphate kinase